MILLRVVCLVEDKKVYLIHGDEGMHQTLIQDLCCAYNDHIVGEILSPFFFGPQITAHFSAVAFDFLI